MTLRVGQFARNVKTNEIILITEENTRSSTQDYKWFCVEYRKVCYTKP